MMKKKMYILCIGDLHFTTKTYKRHQILCQEILKVIKELKDDEKLDLVVILGDTLHTMGKINMSLLKEATDLFRAISNLIPLRILIGNHDRMGPDDFLSDVHPFVGCSFPQTIIVHNVVVEEFMGHTLAYVPYVKKGRFWEALNTSVGWENATAIFAHQEFYGAEDGGPKSTDGDQYNGDADQGSFKGVIISGHIHKYQRLNGVVYVGTPLQVDFNEEITKSVSLFHFEKDWNEMRIYLKVPRKITRSFTARQFQHFDIESLDTFDEIKIIIEGTGGEQKLLSSQIKKLETKKIPYNYITTDIKTVYEPRKLQHTYGEELLMDIKKHSNRVRIEKLYNEKYRR